MGSCSSWLGSTRWMWWLEGRPYDGSKGGPISGEGLMVGRVVENKREGRALGLERDREIERDVREREV